MTKKAWLISTFIVSLLIVVEAVALHQTYVSAVLGGNDFYPRWAGARALLVEGRNPYTDEITREIIAVLDPEDRGLNSFSFAYPLHAVFVFLPLAYLSYDWAIAFWMVVVQWAAFATLAVLLIYHGWRPSPFILIGLLLATVFFYPIARSVLLGQFTVHVTLLLALTILALKMRKDTLAGAIFALTTIKPQMVLLVGLWLVVWAMRERRFSFLWGLVAGGAILLASSMVLLPQWPIDFLVGLQRYSNLAGGMEPLEVFLKSFQSVNLIWLKPGLLIALSLATVFVWWKGLRRELPFETVVYWSIVMNLVVFFQTGTTNQTMLLLPFVAWLEDARHKSPTWLLTALVAVVLVALWALFLLTIEGDYESPILFLPLPFLAIVISGFKLSRLLFRASRASIVSRGQAS